MDSSRNYDLELDTLKKQMNELQQLVERAAGDRKRGGSFVRDAFRSDSGGTAPEATEDEQGSIYYSGGYTGACGTYRWEPQHKSAAQLLALDGDKAARVLAALGHKQRLELIRAVLRQPMTGTELVERLDMGTTGQLYHHLKALTGADLLVQEERGGTYSVPAHRVLPLLLLLGAVSDLLDTSDYIELTYARNQAGTYLGSGNGCYDPVLLLWSVLENVILEHKAGYCTMAGIFLNPDGGVTVSDNGRGIPVAALKPAGKPNVQTVLTELARQGSGASASYLAPGGDRGISMPVVNALSLWLSVEIRRDGSIYRQDYRHGIPQSELLTVGLTNETGTSVTFMPDPELFPGKIDLQTVKTRVQELTAAYPGLQIAVKQS